MSALPAALRSAVAGPLRCVDVLVVVSMLASTVLPPRDARSDDRRVLLRAASPPVARAPALGRVRPDARALRSRARVALALPTLFPTSLGLESDLSWDRPAVRLRFFTCCESAGRRTS